MSLRADNDPKFSRRFFYMGIFALGFGIYCLYDGFFNYPFQRERAFADFRLENKSMFEGPPNEGLTLAEFEAAADEEQRKKWDDYLYERGKPSSGDVGMQFVMAAGSFLVGAWLISIPLRARGRWIEATDTGINSSWGESFSYDQITGVNKRQWRSKGIAKVTYQDGGRKRTFVIDDYKFDRYVTDSILYELEQRIDPSLITGGPPEPPPGEEEPEALHEQAEFEQPAEEPPR